VFIAVAVRFLALTTIFVGILFCLTVIVIGFFFSAYLAMRVGLVLRVLLVDILCTWAKALSGSIAWTVAVARAACALTGALNLIGRAPDAGASSLCMNARQTEREAQTWNKKMKAQAITHRIKTVVVNVEAGFA
jgi:hypothetical protein